MTAVTDSASAFRLSNTRLVQFFRDCHSGSRRLSLHALALLGCFAVTVLFHVLDQREFLGANVWHKPAKFFFSLATQLATVAWALSLVPATVRQTRSVRVASWAMIIAAWFEMTYMVFRAARGEASHFNDSSVFAQVAYALMGLGAVTLTAAAAWIGVIIWRNRAGDIWREAAAIGLVTGSVLATLAGGYMSRQTGHWVGGELSDATGLPLFLWSTTGGDLRIAHFVGQHAMQAVPFAALSGRRSVVIAVTLAVILATAGTFVQAVMGIPLFRG
jgi:hypothetical protein